MKHVVITGLGAISGHGMSVKSLWDDLLSGHSAIRELEPPYNSTRIKLGAMIPGYNPIDHFEIDQLNLLDRVSQLAVLAARAAVEDAGLSRNMLTDAAALIGSGCGGKETDEITYQRLYKESSTRVHPLTIPRGMPSAAASMVTMDLGIKGPSMLVSSACASGAHAIIQGAMMIEAGIVDVAIVGASDAPFTHGLLKSWEALKVISNDGCRPFSKDRNGIVLGEGAGMLVLESEAHARNRDAKIYSSIAGYGMSADASHITRPDTDGISRAIRKAIESAGLHTDQIDYINAHGTGTKANDSAETVAIHKALGNHAMQPLVSSTKSMHGHGLGASSALEAIATTMSIYSGIAPPTTNTTEIDSECNLNHVIENPKAGKFTTALTNSFAFGGLNTCIALSRYY